MKEHERIGRHLEDLARAGWTVTTNYKADKFTVALQMMTADGTCEHLFKASSLEGALAKAVGG